MKPVNSILLIDDDADFNILHKRLLTKMGVANHIQIATDGKQAVEFLLSEIHHNKGYPDIIFLDINMPVMNGWHFLREYEIMIEKVFSKAVLIMFTLFDDELIRKKALEIKSINEFLIKPLNEQDINYILGRYFETPAPLVS